jgi:hypothetical protein
MQMYARSLKTSDILFELMMCRATGISAEARALSQSLSKSRPALAKLLGEVRIADFRIQPPERWVSPEREEAHTHRRPLSHCVYQMADPRLQLHRKQALVAEIATQHRGPMVAYEGAGQSPQHDEDDLTLAFFAAREDDLTQSLSSNISK